MSISDTALGRIELRGPKIQYASGRVTTPRPFDLDDVLAEFVQLPDNGRASFMSILAHSFTVDLRATLLDRPISEVEADKAWQLNEWLHQLTSCLDPDQRWSADSEAQLIRNIATDSFRHGLEMAVGRAIATATGNTITPARKHATARG